MFKWFTKPAMRSPRDPMDHPEIARMSQRELADLPLRRPAAPVVRLADYRAPRPAGAPVRPGLCLG
ncbi:hypothetical protein [Pseudooceanicola algae]|uniref:Uncharacterized protein n=1 Tax=Pseudooceanicola algae TaxID=1537215 RepID=A0A418SGC0_9RHOB|nr:hypothetical protein [Pseudooceanicola algae]QPM91730.1 hypothetical protein PSAL_029850 [Pseudooceanicola algae]